jgi:hypothetical protein
MVPSGTDRRPLLVLVTSNLNNPVYFAASAVALDATRGPRSWRGRWLVGGALARAGHLVTLYARTVYLIEGSTVYRW